MITTMKKLQLLLFVCLGLSTVSCERALMDADESSDPVSVFEYLWTKVDEQYAFFDIKDVDWNAVHDQYRPLVYEGMTDDSLFNVCAAMLNTLRDGHTNLISDFDISRNDTVYYKMIAEKNINPDLVTLNYLTIGYHTTAGFAHNAIRDGKVAFIRYSSFENSITNDALVYLTNRYSSCKGMILDLRQNGGGNVDNVGMLLSMFKSHGQLLYHSQIKSGPGHDDFTELGAVYADSTSADDINYNRPVAVLIDRGSYSATSFFAVCTMAYDNIKLFGDYSGGGLGLPNGGMLPNGWTYRFSITRTIAIDGGNYENGVPPDVRVLLDSTYTAQGIDNVIETAADWILSEK